MIDEGKLLNASFQRPIFLLSFRIRLQPVRNPYLRQSLLRKGSLDFAQDDNPKSPL